MHVALALALACAACGGDAAPDPGSAECRRAHDEFRSAVGIAMRDRMAQLGSWGEKPDMAADMAVGAEMAEAMTERTMTRGELATMRQNEAKGGSVTPAWERAFTAAAGAIDACGESVAPSPR